MGYFGLIVLATAFVMLTVMREMVRKKWPMYKCNPMVMQLAPFFGKDPSSAFEECTAENVDKSASGFTGPFHAAMGNIGVAMGDVAQRIEENNFAQTQFGNFINGRLDNVATTLKTTFASMQFLVLKIRAIMGKLVALYLTLLYGMYSMVKSVEGIISDKEFKKGINLMTSL